MTKHMSIGRLRALLWRAGLMAMMTGSVTHAEAKPAETRKPYGRDDLTKMISVVKTKTPPVIDGIMEKGEWDDAAAITGLTRVDRMIDQQGVQGRIDNIASDQSTFWITYDEECLYIAHHSPPPARLGTSAPVIAVMLKKNQSQHDANIDWDDSIHVAIIDPAWPGGDKYVIQINSTGTTFECVWGGASGKVPGISVGWDPKIISQSTLTLNGWVLETAIPWNGLGPNIKKPRPGDVKHMNFGRIWQEAMKEGHAWAADDTAAAVKNLGPKWTTAEISAPAGELLFMGDEGIVVQLEDTGNLPCGQAAFAAHIRNAWPQEKHVVVEVSTDSGELKDQQEMTLEPGENAPYKFTGKIANFATTKITFTVTDAATGKRVHVTTLPVIRPTTPEIYARRYRGLDRMKFETDIAFIGAADLKKASVTLTVANQATKQQVVGKTFTGFTSYQPAFEFSTKDWAAGDYEARFVVTAPGMKPYTTVVPYTHPALPEWWNNTYGYEDVELDKVPYPWTAMTVEGGAIQVWGREYRLGKRLLPEQITTLDYPMLRAPMRLVMKTSDGEVIDTAAVESTAKWTKTNRTRVEGERMIEGKNVSLKNTVWAEYDGLVWNTLTIEPKNKIDIVSMELELPLTKEFSDIINTRDYSLRTTGKLKPQGFIANPTRAVWLGNAEGGIQWFCETDGWFFLKNPDTALQVKVKDGMATLHIVMIDVPTKFDAPHEIQFGFTATPVRPKTWRTPEHPRYRNYPSGRGMFWDNYNQVVPGALNKMSGLYIATDVTNPGQEAFKLYADEWRPDAKDRSSTKTGPWVDVTMASKSLRNYYAWRHWYRQNKYSQGFSGLYYDCSGALPSANPYVNTGYKRRDGSLATTYPYLAEREITKRLYNITLSNPEFASRDAWIGYHHSGLTHVAYMSFATENWNAENYNSIINANQQTYRGVVDPAMYRAEHLGHNFGWPIFFLGQSRIRREWVEANGGAEAVFDQIYGLNLLHDGGGVCAILPGITAALETRRKNDVDELGLNHWAYQFVPYWKQDLVYLPDPNMYASFYMARPSKLTATRFDEPSNSVVGVFDSDSYFDKHLTSWIKNRNRQEVELARKELERMKDKTVMIVYNDSAWEGVMRLRPDWEKIGLGSPGALKADNALHRTGFRVEKVKDPGGKEVEKAVFFNRPEEYARIEGEELVFPMTKWNYRMIVIEKK